MTAQKPDVQSDRIIEALNRRCADAETKAEKLRALLLRWSNFDFDCPDEYNKETHEDEEDGWALNKLYEDTAEALRG